MLQLLEFAWPGDRGALQCLSGGHSLFSNVKCQPCCELRQVVFLFFAAV